MLAKQVVAYSIFGQGDGFGWSRVDEPPHPSVDPAESRNQQLWLGYVVGLSTLLKKILDFFILLTTMTMETRVGNKESKLQRSLSATKKSEDTNKRETVRTKLTKKIAAIDIKQRVGEKCRPIPKFKPFFFIVFWDDQTTFKERWGGSSTPDQLQPPPWPKMGLPATSLANVSHSFLVF